MLRLCAQSSRWVRICKHTRSSRSASTLATGTWTRLQREATEALESSNRYGHGLIKLFEKQVLKHSSLADGLSATVGSKLSGNSDCIDFEQMCATAYAAEPDLIDAACADLHRFLTLDPAADGFLRIYLFFKGFHSVQCARVAHHYWSQPGGGGRMLASALQSEMSNCFGVDIHPASRWGRGITMDHGTGCVIGETAVIGDNCYLMHDVTLGATGTSTAHDRHPKIGRGVFLAAKATVLGNIRVGDNALVGAHAPVNKDVPTGWRAVGCPAKLLPPNDKPKVAPSGQVMPLDDRLVMGAGYQGSI